ncbi:MAG: hypothetical protein QN189_05185 [Armatimonadota bacterium]|nr:hypothetical protein [Armatimonadota bacterium]
MNQGLRRLRFPLLALGFLALLLGMWAGLLRIGWDLPRLRGAFPASHGPLMVSGFLGTLIGLERAVALGQAWSYSAPLLTGLGAVALILGLPSQWLMVLGSLGFVAVFLAIVRRQTTVFTIAMAGGAVAWFVGNLLWAAGTPLFRAVPWWIAFLTLTIAGERLELSRLVRLSAGSRSAFVIALGLFSVGIVVSPFWFMGGLRISGVAMVALALWFLLQDIARRTVREPGLPRFTAICLLSGYAWLGLSGLATLFFFGEPAGPRYDAILHTFFLGFVFAMIFGHAPIIFPAILGLPLSFQPSFYAHLILLHLSLALRVASDLLLWIPGRRWGGLLNVLALLVFLGNTLRARRRG